MKKLLFFIILIIPILFITGCGNDTSKYLDEINFNELTKLIKEEKSFILEVYQDGCSHCSVFNPRFKAVLNEYEVNAKAINMTNLSNKEYEEFKEIFGILSTPTVIFIENGFEKTKINRLVGEASKKEIIRKLKQNGYIEE